VNNGTASTVELVATLLPDGRRDRAQRAAVLRCARTARGRGLARPFTFTAAAACGGTLTATLHLQDGSTDLGTVSFTFTLGTSGAGGTQTFTNAATVAIPTSGNATPYPSSIAVSGLGGTVTEGDGDLTGFAHGFPDDVDVAARRPGRRADVAPLRRGRRRRPSAASTSPSTTRRRPRCPTALPHVRGLGSRAPTSRRRTRSLHPPPPRPTAPRSPSSTAPTRTGTWSLFVRDDFSGGSGTIAGGWSLSITTSAPSAARVGRRA
jgi:hypothetical protein